MYSNLGDLLFTEAPNPKVQTLPSPNQLRRKILVKAKRQTTSEDAASMASEPQLQHPRINEASTPLLSEKTTTPPPSHQQPTSSSKSLKLKKMHPTRARTTSLPCKTKHDKHEHGKGDDNDA